MTARPWKVFVRDIGPTFSFVHEHSARVKAARLVSPGGCGENGSYAEVIVSNLYGVAPADYTRTVYRCDGPPRIQRWSDKAPSARLGETCWGWVDAADLPVPMITADA